jgi:hypothetical protein
MKKEARRANVGKLDAGRTKWCSLTGGRTERTILPLPFDPQYSALSHLQAAHEGICSTACRGQRQISACVLAR